MEDHDIVALFESRDEEAIRQCREQYERYCFHIAHRILGCREDAEEVVSDTYLKAWNTIPPQKPQSVKSYLGMLTRQGALNRVEHRQTEKRGGGMVDIALSELEECLAWEDGNIIDQMLLRDALNRFLRDLSPVARKVMIQRYWYFCSVEEIARSCRLTESNVKVTLHRTRAKLKKYLEKEGLFV